ncbi:MAG: D-alanine--D-alanine ligase [Planctomycetota bacterium]|nr:D-alanine--D-alanine ligase [Planctomycetota bacterium]
MVAHKHKNDRLRVAVLMGGPSSEHEVSLRGGQNVVAVLSREIFHVRPVVITKEGLWRMPRARWEPAEPDPETGAGGWEARDCDGWREYEGACEGLVALREWEVDVALPILHGEFGEDGTLQAMLSAAGIPFVGSDMAGSVAAFDKVRTKQIVRDFGIATPEYEVVEVKSLQQGRRACIEAWGQRFGFPLIIKNPRGGSSVEVRVAHDEGEVLAAIEELAPGAERLMVERHIRGRELTVGVLEDRDEGGPVALPVVEIRPRAAGHFDYHEKYAADGAEELCPAPIDTETSDRARGIGLTVHRALGLRGLSRTDLILTADGQLEFLEVNTLPGMTERGLVPLAAAATGIDFATLIARLVRTARR